MSINATLPPGGGGGLWFEPLPPPHPTKPRRSRNAARTAMGDCFLIRNNKPKCRQKVALVSFSLYEINRLSMSRQISGLHRRDSKLESNVLRRLPKWSDPILFVG